MHTNANGAVVVHDAVPPSVHPGTAAAVVELRKVYGHGDAAVVALDHLTLELDARRFTAIMGPSGSGKSTLLHCMAGLERPTSAVGTSWSRLPAANPFRLVTGRAPESDDEIVVDRAAAKAAGYGIVSGMTCGGCAQSVRDVVARVEGVIDVVVRLDGTVTLTSDTPIDGGRVKAAVDDAGYEVTA